MPQVKIEQSGCCERHGLCQVRLAMYLEPGDYGYERCHIRVPVIPEGGYTGAVDTMGSPVDQADYDAWINSLPKVRQLNPFHNHFLHLEPDVTDQEIEDLMAFHLPNFYEAWRQDYGEVAGGMRKGWDVKHRKRPKRYEKLISPAEYNARKGLCIARLVSIKSNSALITTDKGGELFPATEIDVGADAIDRTSPKGSATYVGKNNPANDTGSIDTIEMWFDTNGDDDGANVEVATFSASGNVLTSRDSEVIGTVTKGSKQTFTGKDMDIATGDYIGIYYTAGWIETTIAGGLGHWYKGGDHIPCISEAFISSGGRIFSLYGTGETPPPPVVVPTVTTQAVDNIGFD